MIEYSLNAKDTDNQFETSRDASSEIDLSMMSFWCGLVYSNLYPNGNNDFIRNKPLNMEKTGVCESWKAKGADGLIKQLKTQI